MAVAILTLLWLHISIKQSVSTGCLIVATALWFGQRCFWLLRVLWRNVGVGHNSIEAISLHEDADGKVTAVTINIKVKKNWRSLPGQYLYLTLPNQVGTALGCFQAHPYSIVWLDNPVSTGTQNIRLLIEVRRGFSNAIRVAKQAEQRAIVDGPYGISRDLTGYDKILFLASGIGITAHLSHVRDLLAAHRSLKARVRRVSLMWMVDTPGA